MTEDEKDEVEWKRFGAMVSAVLKWRRKMIRYKIYTATATCPSCGIKGAAHIRRAKGNDHIHAMCQKCGWSIMG